MLFPGVALKAHLRRNHELGARRDEASGQRLPFGQRQHHAQMRHRHQMIAHASGVGGGERFAQMQRDLVPEEVEIDPGRRAAALAAAEHPAIEGAGFVQIADVIGEAAYLAIKNGLIVIGLGSEGKINQAHACLYGGTVGAPVFPSGISIWQIVQNLLSAPIIFLFLLGVRNNFKIK